MKDIAIFGSTGLIGTSTLNAVRENRNMFNVVTLVAGKNIDKLIEQIKEFNIEKLTSNITFQILDVKFEVIDEELKEERIKVVLSDGREGYIFHMQWTG